ncbi:hypothetical protein COCON_G00110980 [Conger conger]|uniref:KIND domain-containing protein n=1 Tax=Conger conger TaxID=82655 RepID=A0A9Q1DJL2_CONCO|nr:hypothetical protein COCON_G00110980 [Conger conger]
MARSANSRATDGDSRVSAPPDRAEVRDLSDPRELSLEEVLKSYEQPINEEQAWAVCYQCCSGLSAPLLAAETRGLSRVKDPSSILLCRDGTVSLQKEPSTGNDDDRRPPQLPVPERQMVQSLGVAIYRALDWGLDESEERELSPRLERLIERMVGGEAGNGTADEGYSGQEEEEEEEEEEEGGTLRAVCSFRQAMALCASRLANPTLAPEHYQGVCRALFVETLELQTFLAKIRDAKEMLKKIRTEDPQDDRCTAELDALKHTDWARLWVQLMRELRQGVKLKKVQEQQFDPLPTEFRLTPFEMLMQDIRARKFQLRKVMVDGDIPTRVKQDAHELILDFIRSRPPLKPVSERSLRPPLQEQQSLHERILAEIKQERKLRPVEPPSSKRSFGSLPCLLHTCPCDVKSTSCIDLSITDSAVRPPSRPRVLLKAPTLAEMEEMNIFEDEDSPDGSELRRTESSPTPLKRDRSFSEHDLAELRGRCCPRCPSPASWAAPWHGGPNARDRAPWEGRGRPRCTEVRPVPLEYDVVFTSGVFSASFPVHGWMPPSPGLLCAPRGSLSAVEERAEVKEVGSPNQDSFQPQWMEEFSHPVESLALTVDEVINVRRVLVKAEMEKFLPSKDLYNNLRKGKVCCCCKIKFPLFSWPSTCLLCKRSVCGSCSAKMKIPSKKMAHIPVYTVGFESAAGSHARRSELFKSLRGLSRRGGGGVPPPVRARLQPEGRVRGLLQVRGRRHLLQPPQPGPPQQHAQAREGPAERLATP